jgi:hypothetical protein
MMHGVNEKVTLHAVMRHDGRRRAFEDSVTIVAVLPTRAEADREISRLSRLKDGSDSTYFYLPARYYPDGRAAGDT